MKRIALIIESVQEGQYWGRVHYEDDLIVEEASSLELLERKMKNLLKDFHGLNPKTIEFDLQYDIVGLFEEKNFLNVSAIAQLAGINSSLMRQYTAGKKFPSFERASKIISVINEIGKDLRNVKLASLTYYQSSKPAKKKGEKV